MSLLDPHGGVVYVMRHGRTVLDDEQRSDGWLDYPLSDKGRVGLIKVQQYLKNSKIDTIYTSSLRRAFETAHILASGILSNPKIETDENTRTWHLGFLIGTKKKPNKPVVRYYMDHPLEKPLGGESMKEFHDRFIPWLNKIIARSRSGQSFLVVTSGSNLRMIGKSLVGDKDRFDLDESGLMALIPTEHGAKGQVIFGHKSEHKEDFS